MLWLLEGEQEEGKALGGLSFSSTASSCHMLLPLYFVDKDKADSLLMRCQRALQAVVFYNKVKGMCLQTEIR